MWKQFRRLLLGTVADILLEERLPMDFSTFTLHFGPDCVFKVPRLDNYMRFVGDFSVTLLAEAPQGLAPRIEDKIRTAWKDLLAVLDIPVGDRLTLDKAEVRARIEGRSLRVAFDLSAD